MLTREFSQPTNRRIALGLLGVSALAALAMAYSAYSEHAFERLSAKALGVVTRVNAAGTKPTVRFTDGSGTEREFVPSSESSLRTYVIGEQVPVAYLTGYIKDPKLNEFLHIWSLTSTFGYLAAVFAILGILVYRGVFVVGPLRQTRLGVDAE